jgi:RNA polymerase sigma factor (sigma-70 family)
MMAGGTNAQGPTQANNPAAVPPALADRDLLERFTRRQDQAAFAALVARHGPMVLAVCRRVLGHVQEAEDAFQATFLVLVRKAADITQPELLANWLYGVAARTARKARTGVARRLHHERQAAVATLQPSPDPGWSDLVAQLDEELERLPFKYRAPLVLCYLEGLTNEEAARRLGWPTGSISYRLNRGRDLLRQRLGGRAFPAAAFASQLHDELAPVEMPPTLSAHTVHLAVLLAGGATLEAATPAVRGLVEGMLASMKARRTRALSTLLALLVAALLALGAAAATAAGYVGGMGSTGESTSPAPTSSGGCH